MKLHLKSSLKLPVIDTRTANECNPETSTETAKTKTAIETKTATTTESAIKSVVQTAVGTVNKTASEIVFQTMAATASKMTLKLFQIFQLKFSFKLPFCQKLLQNQHHHCH